MARKLRANSRPGSPDIDAAREALNTGEPRNLIRDMLPWLDGWTGTKTAEQAWRDHGYGT